MLTPACNYVYTVEPANVEYILKTNYGKGSTGPRSGRGRRQQEERRDSLVASAVHSLRTDPPRG
ncbi:hypothetical protein C2845_PM01G43600 [Panicum miliaceum]|uniref:Uncharacterized protein n=1 Tax=Panicum miliaceum TaxID=4540 RepID=A0A3L6TLA1_PANMI|nr:hypothetical protein C2845_PM01G43600 [Panicum miliaceum]